MNEIWVVAERRGAELHSSTFELLGKSRELSEKNGFKVTLVLLSHVKPSEETLESLYRGGADKIILAIDESFERFTFGPYTKVLKELVDEYSPEIILAPATTSGRSYMPGLAALLNTGLTADCTGLDIEEGTGNLLQTRPAIGGNIIATIKTPNHRPQLATVRPKTFSPLERTKSEKGELIEHEVGAESKKTPVKLIKFVPLSSSQKGVQDAEIIIAGGMGLRRAENLEPLYTLAKLLRGTVGASRKIVDSKWIGHETQVGLSGHTVKPKVYVAVGISGAVQHIAGMQTAEFIVAINRDRNASIFNFADIGLVGEASEILEELINSIEAEIAKLEH